MIEIESHPNWKFTIPNMRTLILGTFPLVQWILGFGAEALVMEPHELRGKLASTADTVAGLYRPSAA